MSIHILILKKYTEEEFKKIAGPLTEEIVELKRRRYEVIGATTQGIEIADGMRKRFLKGVKWSLGLIDVEIKEVKDTFMSVVIDAERNEPTEIMSMLDIIHGGMPKDKILEIY